MIGSNFTNEIFKLKNNFESRAFTLIEVIVSLVLIAIFGTILTVFMKNSLSQSSMNLIRVRNTYDLSEVMENMTAFYKESMASTDDANPLNTFRNSLGTAGNSYVNDYGKYTLSYNGYISFNCSGKNCTETSGTEILKVTITDPANEQKLTAFFTE